MYMCIIKKKEKNYCFLDGMIYTCWFPADQQLLLPQKKKTHERTKLGIYSGDLLFLV